MIQTPPLIAGRPSQPARLPPERRVANRIFRISFRSNYNGKLVRTLAKVPYSGLFGLSDVLVRALSTNEIGWYRLEPLKPREITDAQRARLQRWPEALRATSERSGVTWLA